MLFKIHEKQQCRFNDDQPAVVAANTPHADACDGLRVKHAAVHGINQVQRIVLQQQVHVLALNEHTKHPTHSFPSKSQNIPNSFEAALKIYENSLPLKVKCYIVQILIKLIVDQTLKRDEKRDSFLFCHFKLNHWRMKFFSTLFTVPSSLPLPHVLFFYYSVVLKSGAPHIYDTHV